MDGWVKLHRQICESDIWIDDEPFDYRSAWIDLILTANHKDRIAIVKGTPIQVLKGQRFTSIRKLSERWHWSQKKVRNFLSILSDMEMIKTEGTALGTLISIEKYDFFQHSDDAKGKAKGTTKGEQKANTGRAEGIRTRSNTKVLLQNEKNEKKENRPNGPLKPDEIDDSVYDDWS